MRRTILRLLSSFRSSRAERELAREIRSHLQCCRSPSPGERVRSACAWPSAPAASAATLIKYTEFPGSETDLTRQGMAMIIGYGIVMLGVCMLGCVVPTRRALNIEPTVALRTE